MLFFGRIDDLRFYVFFNSISVIQGDERVIMKGCVQWNAMYGWKDFHLQHISGQQVSAYPSELPGLLQLYEKVLSFNTCIHAKNYKK